MMTLLFCLRFVQFQPPAEEMTKQTVTSGPEAGASGKFGSEIGQICLLTEGLYVSASCSKSEPLVSGFELLIKEIKTQIVESKTEDTGGLNPACYLKCAYFVSILAFQC